MIYNYLAILLLIAPGFVCRSIYSRLNFGGKRDKEGLEFIISSLLYGVWIYSLNYIILKNIFHYNLRSFDDLRLLFNKIDFVIKFSGLTVISCLVIAVIWSLLYPNISIIPVNAIRLITGKFPITKNTNVWDAVFQEKRQHHAVIIEKDGKEIGKGFIKNISWGINERREIYLDRKNIIDARPDLFDKFNGTYIDLENNLVIKEYDLTKANEALGQKHLH